MCLRQVLALPVLFIVYRMFFYRMCSYKNLGKCDEESVAVQRKALQEKEQLQNELDKARATVRVSTIIKRFPNR